jgi:hypothetical protein
VQAGKIPIVRGLTRLVTRDVESAGLRVAVDTRIPGGLERSGFDNGLATQTATSWQGRQKTSKRKGQRERAALPQ